MKLKKICILFIRQSSKKIEEAVPDRIMKKMKDPSDIYQYIDVNVELSKYSELSNGDKITVTYKYDNEKAKKVGIKFKGKKEKITVKGLKKVKTVDIFKDLELKFEGTAPDLSTESEIIIEQDDASFWCTVSPCEDLDIGDEISIHEEAPKEIVVMKNIAEAIQLCDMNAFDQFLKNLRKVVKDSDRSRQDFLSIFWEQIENDYGNLLKDSCTGIDIVEWFYEKKFYQQAITYIESKLPQEWVKRKLVTMNAEKVDMKAYKNRLGKKHEKDANVLIVEILFCCFKWSEIVKLQYNQKTKKQERKKVDEFKDPSHLKLGRNPMYKELFLDEYCTELKVKGQSYGEMTFSFNGKNKEKVVDLLLLYRLLKTERNKINHMSSTADRADQATLDRVLKMFVDVGRQAYQK